MLRTIKSTREIDTLFEFGARSANSLVVVLAGKSPEGRGPQGRVAFIAGRRMGNAVVRNRAKRVMRAAVSRGALSWPGWDVALIARPQTGSAPTEALDRSIASALSRAGVTYE